VNREELISALESQRDRINRAIEALHGNHRRPARPKATGENARRGRRRFSAEARKKLAIAARRRWAKAKAAGKSTL